MKGKPWNDVLKNDFRPPSGTVIDTKYHGISKFCEFEAQMKSSRILVYDELRVVLDYMLKFEEEKGTDVWIPIVEKLLENASNVLSNRRLMVLASHSKVSKVGDEYTS